VQLELTPADKLLILASDGVWEFISSKEAVELVGGCDTPEDGCRLVSKGRQAKAFACMGAGRLATRCVISIIWCAVKSVLSRQGLYVPSAVTNTPVLRCCCCCCVQLVDEAHQRWLHEEEGVVDDITAVVVRLVHRH
jgi:serine/threonine protein phosphatase PrpC